MKQKRLALLTLWSALLLLAQTAFAAPVTSGGPLPIDLYVGQTYTSSLPLYDLWHYFYTDSTLTTQCAAACTYTATMVSGSSLVTPDPNPSSTGTGLGNGWFHPLDVDGSSPYSSGGQEIFDVYATDSSGAKSGPLEVIVNINTPPTITSIANQTTNEDTPITGIPFKVNEGCCANENVQSLTVTATSSNTTLVPNGNITVNYTDNGTASASLLSPTLDITPATDQNGTATITVTVQDNGAGNLKTSTSFTVTVNSVNDPPIGANKTVTLYENANYTFATSDFGFSDPNDNPPNNFKNAIIETQNLPTGATLQLSGAAVTNGQVIPVSSLSSLVFTPAANAFGATYASFTFKVQDDGGTANGGQDTSTSAYTMTMDVLSINDAPVAADNTITINEDTPHTFVASDFGFSDPNDNPPDSLANVIVETQSLATGASLTFNGTAVTDGQSIPAGSLGSFVFTPAPNANGTDYSHFTFKVQDNGGTANGGVDTSVSPNTITFNVTSVNDPPVGASKTVTLNEDASYTFATSDFGFSDPNDNPPNNFKNAIIETQNLPTGATLQLSGATVTNGEAIPASSLSSLVFTPAPNANGATYASFTFKVQDDGGTANGGQDTSTSAYTMTMDVLSVNDPPVGANKTITINEDTPYTFAASDFGFSDPNDNPPNSLMNVIVEAQSLATGATLTLGGTAVTNGQSIPAASIGTLKFTPAPNANGTNYASFTFKLQDNGGTANGGVDTSVNANTITFNVTSVNDPPVGASKTVTLKEDTSYTFATSDFGFSDPNDNPPNNFKNAIIETQNLPTGATLQLSGATVTNGEAIPASSLSSLVFTPAPNANGATYASFTFKVQDDGGTANGGQDTSTSAYTMTMDVLSVNDPPVGANKTITIDEDNPYTFSSADFGFSDPNDNPPNSLMNVIVETQSLATGATLELGGTAVTNGQSIPAASIGTLVFTPALNANGTNYSNFTFKLQDNGGTANGGVDTSVNANTITFNVTAVNNPPVVTAPGSWSVNEDTRGTVGGISVSDVDASAGTAPIMTMTLNVSHGTLDVTAGSATVTGTGTSSLTISGSMAAVNSALGTVSYLGTDNYNGSDSLTVEADDNGNTGIGGPKTDTKTVAITVNSVNDPPVYNNTFHDLSVNENSSPLSVDLASAFTDPDIGIGASDSLTYTITLVDKPNQWVKSGVVDASALSGATITNNSPAAGERTIVFTTTASSFQIPFMKDAYGEVDVTVKATDQGLPPYPPSAPIPLSAQGSFKVTVVQTLFEPKANPDSYTTDPALIVPEGSGPLIFDPTQNDYLGAAPVHIVKVGSAYIDSNGVRHAWRTGTRMADPNDQGDMVIVSNGQVSCADCLAGQTSDTTVDGASLSPQTIVYQPNADYYGISTFMYCIEGSNYANEPPLNPPNDQRCSTITVKVTHVNHPPVPQTPITYTMVQGNDLVVPVSQGLVSKVIDIDNSSIDGNGCSMVTDPNCPASSPHPDTLYFRLDSAVTPHGQLLPPFTDTGSFQYQPNPSFSGSDSFTFDVCDINDFSQASHCVYNVPVHIVIQPLQGASTGSVSEAVQYNFQLAEVPLELPIGPHPNVLIVNDDSGSMNWDMLTPEDNGVYHLSNGRTVYYVLTATAGAYSGFGGAAASEQSDPGQGLWRLRNSNFNAVYYNPKVRYMPWKGLAPDGQPFPNSPPSDARDDPMTATPTTDLLTPESYTGVGVGGSTQTCKNVCLIPNWFTGGCLFYIKVCSGGSSWFGSSTISVTNYYIPRYYIWTDKNGNGLVDATPSPVTDPSASEGQLVEIKPAADGGSDTYPKYPNRTDCVTLANACTYQEEIQNFANWFTYYRSRQNTAKAALGQVVAAAQNMRIGFAKINSKSNIEPLKEMNASSETGNKAALLNAIYATTSNGGTPLRSALNEAGLMYECKAGDIFGSTTNTVPGDPGCPVLPAPQGNCQQNFTLLMTDGTWNGRSPDVGNADGDDDSNFDGGMFADPYSNTLADVAMYYYEHDLQPTLANQVPTTPRDRAYAAKDAFANGGNQYMHQHMTTYTVSIGGKGTVANIPLPTDYTKPFPWPDPTSTTAAKLDDLRHAAVDGRGEYFDASQSGSLASSLISAFQEFSAGTGTGAAVSFNSQEIQQNTLVYRAFYNTETNTGDIVAVPLTQNGLGSTPKWSAAQQLDLTTWDKRQIITIDPQTGTGIPFRPDDLTAAQRAVFVSNPSETAAQQETEITNKVDYLRGDPALERPKGNFRERPTVDGRLGDIVHSKPVYVGPPDFTGRDVPPYPQKNLYSAFVTKYANRTPVIYAGANDGMLHAFNANTGQELFAYVPNNLMLDPFSQNITNLINYNYTHKFFVDLTPAVNDVYMDTGSGTKAWQTLLVGGEGAGGKAYFALNVTDPTQFTEADASDVALWEFTDQDDTYPVDANGNPLTNSSGGQRMDLENPPRPVKDLGYSFSEPTIAMSNLKDADGNNEWVVLFGNGYNSTSGIAKLFVLFLDRSNKTVWCNPAMIYDHSLTGGTAPAVCQNADGSIKTDFIKLSTGFGAENGYPNGLGTPRAIDVDGNGTVDYVYAGDLFGNFYRFNLTSSNYHDWTVTKIFHATYTDSSGTVQDQPITTQPIVTPNPAEPNTYVVIFATGSYMTVPDATDTSIQSIYGLWDRLSPQLITKSELVQQRYINLVNTTNGHVRTLTNNPVDYLSAGTTVRGWYNNLDSVAAGGNQATDPPEFPGEKAIRNLQIRGGIAFVNSVIPRSKTSCTQVAGGFALSFCPLTGGLSCLGNKQIFDVNNDGQINSADEVSGKVVAGMRFDSAVPTNSTFIGNKRVTQLSNKDLNMTGTNTSFGDDTGRLSWKQLKSVP